ncbi:hypothetical protein [Cylindrospermum stagnale]|nr:hypothetical protein [Cylindrospermum stagnale]
MARSIIVAKEGRLNFPIKPHSCGINNGNTVELFVQDILGGQPFGT